MQNKIKNIEFLRVIGCLAIIILHFYGFLIENISDIDIYNHLRNMTSNGQKAVDLFFILSGIFFAITLNTKKSYSDFIKKKCIRLLPVLYWGTGLLFLISIFGITDFNLYSNILNLLMLGGIGLNYHGPAIDVFWYVSTMFWVLLFLFYSFKNFDKKYIKLIMALAIFFCYSFLIQAKGGKINSPSQYFYTFLKVGTLRAIGGIFLGYFIGDWYKNNLDRIRNFIPTLKEKIGITIVEGMCIFFIINNLFFRYAKEKEDMIFIVVFVICSLLFLINKGFISQFLNKDIWSKLGVYTYSFYMTHKIIIKILMGTVWKNNIQFIHLHPYLHVVYAFLSIFLLGIITYHFIEQPCAKYLKQKLFPKKDC